MFKKPQFTDAFFSMGVWFLNTVIPFKVSLLFFRYSLPSRPQPPFLTQLAES